MTLFFHKHSIKTLIDQLKQQNQTISPAKITNIENSQKGLKKSGRSISSLKKPCFTNNFIGKPSTQEKYSKSKSLIKNRKSPSSAQISSIFFQGMEVNLMKECDQILKMEKPKRSQSTCQLQSLTENMFFIHRHHKKEDIKGSEKNSSNELILKNLQEERSNQPISLVRVDSMSNTEEEKNIGYLEKQIIEQSDIDFDSDDLTSMHYIEDMHKKKNSDIMDKRPVIESQRSIINSQSRYQKMISSLVNTKAYLISSRFLPKNIGIFSVNKIEFFTKFTPQICIYFEISNEIVFKKIQSANEKRPTDLKLRRYHTRRLQHLRQKSRDKIFSNFNKKGLVTSLSALYEDILSYMEQCTILDHSYRGLALKDQDEIDVLISDQEKILEILSISTYFFFLLRLGSTFFLVKATRNEIKGIHFTFLCDFTTLSTGDQLVFTHNQIQTKYKHRKPNQILIQAVQQFKERAEDEWCRGLKVPDEVSAKIGKIAMQTLEKCEDNYDIWGVNKKFQMIGDITNFFQLHDHFDYGFFNKPLSYFKVDLLCYQLSRKKPILIYQFPQKYEYIEINQMQREAIVISHLAPFSQRYQKRCIKSFYERYQRQIQKKKNTQFVMNLKKQRLKVVIGDNVTIFVESSLNLRGHKLILSRVTFLKDIKSLTVSQLSPRVESTMKKYKLEHSFLYKRYQPLEESQILIYYKSVHKFEGQFAFVTLYKLIKMGLIQFKIFTFKLGRSFMIRLEVQDLTPQQVKQTVSNLIGVFKSVYFKKVLQMEARRSEKRRKEALEEFFKHQAKFNPSNIRGKRKNEEELRKKNLNKLASLRNASIYNPIQEIIITKLCKTYNNRHCYFTIRHLPNKQLKQSKGDMRQQLQVCLYSSQKITYFRYITTLKDIADIITQELRINEQLDPHQMFNIYKGITEKVIKIVKTTCGNFNFLIARLKNLFNPTTKPQKQYSYHPLLFRLIGNNLFQTKDSVNFGKKVATKLSIEFEISNPVSLTSFNLLDQCQSFPSTFKLAIPSFGRISGTIDRIVNLTFLVDVAPDWIIEIIDIYSRGQEYRIGEGITVKDRHVRLVVRQTQKCLVLGEWEGDFVSTIKYTQFNKRMFKRLLRGVRSTF